MSKLGSTTAVAVLGTGGAVGGVYWLKSLNASSDVEFKSLDEFKEANGGECVSQLFEGEREELKTNVTPADGAIDTSFFGETSSDKDRSCLVVDWRKDSYKDSKWEGIFTLTWSFLSSSNKGMAMFLLAKTGEKSKLKLEGGIYLFSREDESGKQKWKLKNKKEVASGKTISSDDFEAHFPKVGTKLTELTPEDKDYWGFMSGKEDIGKTCIEESCRLEGKRSGFRKEWNWEGQAADGTGKLTEWSESGEWLDKVFSDWKLKEKLEKFTGSWKLKT